MSTLAQAAVLAAIILLAIGIVTLIPAVTRDRPQQTDDTSGDANETNASDDDHTK